MKNSAPAKLPILTQGQNECGFREMDLKCTARSPRLLATARTYLERRAWSGLVHRCICAVFLLYSRLQVPSSFEDNPCWW